MTPGADMNAAIRDWGTWATRALLGVFGTALLAVIAWGFNSERRITDCEKLEARIVKLEAEQEGYRAVITDLAVVKTQLANQDKHLDHITKLLEATR